MNDDTISRKAAIDALRTCYDTEAITHTNGNEYIDYDQALDLINTLPSAQPDEEKISDALYYIYRNKGTSTSAEGVAAIKYYIAEIWRDIYGEEGPKWLKK